MDNDRYVADKHGSRWAVWDDSYLLGRAVEVHDTREQAQAAADRRNTPAPPPAQRPRQGALFDDQEAR